MIVATICYTPTQENKYSYPIKVARCKKIKKAKFGHKQFQKVKIL